MYFKIKELSLHTQYRNFSDDAAGRQTGLFYSPKPCFYGLTKAKQNIATDTEGVGRYISETYEHPVQWRHDLGHRGKGNARFEPREGIREPVSAGAKKGIIRTGKCTNQNYQARAWKEDQESAQTDSRVEILYRRQH